MIEDKFTVKMVKGTPSDIIVEAVCKECQHEFDVHMHILKAKNCRHELGRSITVVCPGCQAESTTTELESRICALEEIVTRLRKKIDEHFVKYPTPFRSKEADWDKMSMVLECQKCGTEFTAGIENSKNTKWQPGSLRITCPLCGNSHETTKDLSVERLQTVAAIMQLHKVEQTLAHARKEGQHAAETIQT
jgi:ribosomal protein L44E